MIREYFVKCPRCGEETKGGNECEKCGKGVIPSKTMEVQYKEFRVSELLDIRMSSPAPSREKIKSPEHTLENGNGRDGVGQTDEKQAARKPHILVFAIAIVVAVVAALYLLKFFFLF